MKPDESMSTSDRNLLVMFLLFGCVNWGAGTAMAEGWFLFDPMNSFLSFAALSAVAAVALLLALLFNRKPLRLSWAMGLFVSAGLIGAAVINLYWAAKASAAV